MNNGDIEAHKVFYKTFRMGISWLEIDAIRNLYEKLPQNGMIYSQEELEACQRNPNYDQYNSNCVVTPVTRFQQFMRLQYIYKPE